jgi:hypothetical protein
MLDLASAADADVQQTLRVGREKHFKGGENRRDAFLF